VTSWLGRNAFATLTVGVFTTFTLAVPEMLTVPPTVPVTGTGNGPIVTGTGLAVVLTTLTFSSAAAPHAAVAARLAPIATTDSRNAIFAIAIMMPPWWIPASAGNG